MTGFNALQTELQALIDRGLKFGDALNVFCEEPAARDREAVIEAARTRYGSDEIEIDDNAVLSEGDDGAFVMAWLWVAGAAPADDEDAGEGEGE